MNAEILERLQAISREKYAAGQPVERIVPKPKKVYMKKERVILPDLMADHMIGKPLPAPLKEEIKKHNDTVNKITADRALEIMKEAGIEFVKASDYIQKPVYKKPVHKKPKVDIKKVAQFAGRMSDTPRVPIPEKENKPFKRPPTEYSNSKSLYGIDYNDI